MTLESIHDYSKWLIHHVWLSIRLNNLVARHKTLIEQWTVLKTDLNQSYFIWNKKLAKKENNN